MSTTPPATNLLRERIKLALAPLLAIVLGAVVWQNYKPAAAPLPKPPPRRAPNGQPAAVAATATTIRSKPNWPKLSLEEVLAHDPFSPPAAALVPSSIANAEDLPGSEALEEEEAPAAIRPFSGRVEAIYRLGDQAFAIVDSHTVRLGDRLHGQRVIQIGPDGILLEGDPE